MARNFISASTQKITIPTAAQITNVTTTATLSMWIYGTSFPGAYNAFWGLTGSNAGIKTYVRSTAKLAFYVGSAAVYDGTGTNTLSAGRWYHTAFTSEFSVGSTGYLDGSQDGTNAAVGGIAWTAPVALMLGDDGITRWWNGRMADACIWNVVLTASEISRLARGLRAKYVRPDKIVAYYPLTGIQPYEPDLSPYANHGTLSGPSFIPDPPLIPDMNQILTIAGREVPIMSPGPSFISGWSRQSNLPVIGGGTF